MFCPEAKSSIVYNVTNLDIIISNGSAATLYLKPLNFHVLILLSFNFPHNLINKVKSLLLFSMISFTYRL